MPPGNGAGPMAIDALAVTTNTLRATMYLPRPGLASWTGGSGARAGVGPDCGGCSKRPETRGARKRMAEKVIVTRWLTQQSTGK